ncbi:MAG: NAD(P)-binding domain-containing protein [Actinomycetales bacterium]
MTRFGFIGVGSIASSIVAGLCEGVDDPPDVLLSPRNARRSAELAERLPSVRVAVDNQAVVDGSDIVVLCVLPHLARQVLAPLNFRPDHQVVSALAGVHLEVVRALVAPADDVARSIPVPAVATRASLTPVHPPSRGAQELYGRLGGLMPIDDELAYESVAAASATVAAHYRYLATIAEWLAEHGIGPGPARAYVAATFADLGRELTTEDVDFDRLAAAHTTPGGLNEQFATHLANTGTYAQVRSGLDGVLGRIAPAQPSPDPDA